MSSLWWLLMVLPTVELVAGLYMVVSRRVPWPESLWEQRWRRMQVMDVKVLGWYHMLEGSAYLALFAYLISALLVGYEGLSRTLLAGLALAFLLLLGTSILLRRRAFPPAAPPAPKRDGRESLPH